jgi:hypothetical protein
MAKKWVLHTETKGTGAQMVPLESITERSSATQPVFVPREPTRRPEPEPKARVPKRFRVLDVMTREPLIDDGSTRETIDALGRVRSIVDVNVYVWHEREDRWRLLSLAEQRAMWDIAQAA